MSQDQINSSSSSPPDDVNAPFVFDKEKISKIQVTNITPPALVPQNISAKLINLVARKLNCSPDTAFVIIATLCQKGGSAKKAQGNIFTIVDGVRVELNTIREIIKQNNLNITLRQWARTHATNIYIVCEAANIHGDLAKKLSRNRPDLQESDLIWMSNFQMDNPSCPENVRKLLLEHYNSMFSNQ